MVTSSKFVKKSPLFITVVFFAGYSQTEIQRTCTRCQLNVIESDGVYNLLVENVRLGQDEYFECQVSPGKGATNSVPLRAPVHITIQGTVIHYYHTQIIVLFIKNGFYDPQGPR